MKSYGRYALKRIALALALFLSDVACAEKSGASEAVRLTHADAAIFLVKHFNFFDGKVDASAGVNECVAFLNSYGVYFGLLEVVSHAEYTKEDCARSMGQITLLLEGNGQHSLGDWVLPDDVASWVEYCMLNNIKYMEAHMLMRDMLLFLESHKK